MSLITRCPTCNTMFKVVADQLRISEGWVRCGQCNEVFDASAQLQEPLASPSPKPRKPNSKKPPAATHSELDGRSQDEISESEVSPPRLPKRYKTSETKSRNESLLDDGFGADFSSSRLAATDKAQAPLQELSFMRSARTNSRWDYPWVRTLLLVLGPVLVWCLAFQIVIHERDRLVALEPELKPWMAEICRLAQCEVADLRQIESMVITSSSFNKVRDDVYRLNFTLKNTASMTLAHPAIELSVTDVRDQPILRRVFYSADIGPRSGLLPASSESSASLTLGIKPSHSSERIIGYRILAFYP